MIKLLLYCTKAKPYLVYDYFDKVCCKSITADKIESYHLNGKIVAECECEKIDEWFWNGWWNCYAKNSDIDVQIIDEEDIEKSCLNQYDLYDYLLGETGYAIHLSNVKVLNSPLQFKKDFIYKDYKTNAVFTKAPQNMCNVYDRFGNHYILISIQPQHLAKILNGEKTIEVRKKILNSMKEML